MTYCDGSGVGGVVGVLMLLLLLGRGGIVRGGWVDPDTNEKFYSIKALSDGDEREYRLVFSDEFDQDNRTFKDGDDPRWTALDKNDYTNDALHFYSSDNVRTSNGVLNITTNFRDNSYVAFDEDTKEKFVETKYIQSAMVQGWNKFCFTGGIVEISARLPGKPKVGGLWPAIWIMGNLARATYIGTSNFVWPWSYNHCDPQYLVSQEITACNKVDHYGLHPFRGRGAPEIDILEAMPGEPGPLPNTHIERPYFSASLQVAPGKRNNRPSLGFLPRKEHWYDGLEYGNVTKSGINPFFYGVTLLHKPKPYTYQSDALSANMRINKTHFEKQHKYRLEWDPPDESGHGGYLRWFCDDELVYGIRAESLQLTGAEIPSEPSYVLLNTAVSSSWGFPKPCPDGCECDCYQCGNAECTCGLPLGFCDNIPASFEIDYVRVYQAVNESKHELGCSTQRRPTDLFIQGHKTRYMQNEQDQPLKNIKQGGGICLTHHDCGGTNQGLCQHQNKHSRNKHCTCHQGYTGPNCLAHDAFHDTPEYYARPQLEELRVRNIDIPHGFYMTFLSLVAFFCIAVIADVARKKQEEPIYDHDTSIQPRPNGYPYNHITPSSYSHVRHTQQLAASLNITANEQYELMKQYNGVNELFHTQQQMPLETTPIMNTSSSREKVVSYCVIDGRLMDT
eukprot:CAMPEP_0172498338 /NCGR_PEP_ID=MMETSP1066-20121228/112544_1 /TAXON_ID=671091 /ORGANISM="Coscinodiscus wailesii, Strain CCMP2513" /LENGTH=675 /DNA_ID=CAMNT_0013271577 /DNA_START=211 /DNA_END=2238 /DNA_ORIENTATION=+